VELCRWIILRFFLLALALALALSRLLVQDILKILCPSLLNDGMPTYLSSGTRPLLLIHPRVFSMSFTMSSGNCPGFCGKEASKLLLCQTVCRSQQGPCFATNSKQPRRPSSSPWASGEKPPPRSNFIKRWTVIRPIFGGRIPRCVSNSKRFRYPSPCWHRTGLAFGAKWSRFS
jgi:hypothetical protein